MTSIAERLLNGGHDIRSEWATPGPGDDFWYTAIDTMGAGRPVTPDAAMRVSAWYACMTVLTEDIASLPLILYEKLARGGKDRADAAPLSRTLRLTPNRLQTSFEWREMSQGHVMARGNAYSVKQPTISGGVELVPLHPDRVKVSVTPQRIRVYTYRDPDGDERKFLDDEIFHLPGRDFDGVTGKSVMTAAIDALAVAASAQRSAVKMFEQGMKTPGVLQHPGPLSDEAHQRLRDDFAEKNLGLKNWHKPILLEEGMTWQSMSMTSQEAEASERYKLSLEDIARFFRMPQHKIGILDHATFSNIEHMAIDYVVGTLRPWLVRWEQKIATDLILDLRLFAEFLIDALLRGDAKSRWEAYALARNIGVLSANEIRAPENMNALEGSEGEDRWRPLNMARATDPTSAQLAAQRGSQAQATGRAALFAESLAVRLVQREVDRVGAAAKRFAADGDGWATWLEDFYAGHAMDVAKAFHVDEAAGHAYAMRQVRELKSAGIACMELWPADRPAELVELALAS